MKDKYAEFEEQLNTDLTVSVSTVVEAATSRALSSVHLGTLLDTLIERYPGTFAKATSLTDSAAEDPGYGADFDLSEEVNSQIRVVRSLRNMITDPTTGAIKEGYSARDAKELVGSSNTMLTSLMKFHDKIINQDRTRAMEAATIEAVRTLPQAEQDRFFSKLEEGLAAIK